jgi:hypothetical protein
MEDASMTSDNVTEVESVESSEAASAKAVDDGLIDELVGRAQAEGLQPTGEGGLLQQLTKGLLESALGGEFTDHVAERGGTLVSVVRGSADESARARLDAAFDSDDWNSSSVTTTWQPSTWRWSSATSERPATGSTRTPGSGWPTPWP